MTSLALALLLASSPSLPPAAAPLSWRIHVVASEELDADALRALARPAVVLWLQTRSNALRLSTVQRVARFREAYVELRSPLLPSQTEQLRAIPAAGIWVRGEGLRGDEVGRLGVRRLAWSTSGPLEALRPRWQSLRPVRVRWAVDRPVDLAGWAAMVQLPGAISVTLPPGPGESPACEARTEPLPEGRSVRFVATTPAQARALARCGLGVVLAIEPDTSAKALLDLFRDIPSLELEVTVGADAQRAWALRSLLAELDGQVPLKQR